MALWSDRVQIQRCRLQIQPNPMTRLLGGRTPSWSWRKLWIHTLRKTFFFRKNIFFRFRFFFEKKISSILKNFKIFENFRNPRNFFGFFENPKSKISNKSSKKKSRHSKNPRVSPDRATRGSSQASRKPTGIDLHHQVTN